MYSWFSDTVKQAICNIERKNISETMIAFSESANNFRRDFYNWVVGVVWMYF